MGFRDWGNPPIYSTTAASGSNPDSTTLCAQILNLADDLYEVRWTVGASTGALWNLDHCLSTGYGSTAIRQRVTVYTGSNQTSEFVTTLKAERGDLFRIIPGSTFTGTFAATIQTEKLT